MRKVFLAALVSAGPYLWAASSSKDFPSWVVEVSTRKMPAYAGKVPAAVLLDEQHVTVDPSGAISTVTRCAIKILTHDGRQAAVATAGYYKNGRQVKELRAWLIAPSGFQKTFDKGSVVDLGAFDNDELYSDIRYRMIRAENPEIGSVFAFESVVQESALFAQDDYDFQDELPVVLSRYVLTLPAGWTAAAVVFNHEPFEPIVDGSTSTWELKELPYREHEEHAPGLRGLRPRLAVNFVPVNGGRVSAAVFHSWTDVSRWHSSLSEGQDYATPEISTKVAELTSGAKGDLEKIRAIGHYVQQLRYVAVEMDLAHGGGYKPHSAEMVFKNQYGDCKDKANLMRAMLKAAGVPSYLVAIFSGDRTYVKEAWPSPGQFNHMILAAKVPEGTSGPTVIDSPIGRLLIFDPTDDLTPVGDLPWYEQNSFALLCAGDKGRLLKMPATKPEANSTDVTVSATLTASGDLAASLISSNQGQPADSERRGHAGHSTDEYKTHMQRLINQRAKGAIISKLETEDRFDDNNFQYKLDFDSHSYAQVMQRLLVFAPSIAMAAAPEFAQNAERSEPILLRARIYREHVRIQLPPGFAIDEMPEPFKAESEFAKASMTFKSEAGQLLMEEDLRTEAVTLSPDQFTKVKKFFDNFHGADNQKAVLVKN